MKSHALKAVRFLFNGEILRLFNSIVCLAAFLPQSICGFWLLLAWLPVLVAVLGKYNARCTVVLCTCPCPVVWEVLVSVRIAECIFLLYSHSKPDEKCVGQNPSNQAIESWQSQFERPKLNTNAQMTWIVNIDFDVSMVVEYRGMFCGVEVYQMVFFDFFTLI